MLARLLIIAFCIAASAASGARLQDFLRQDVDTLPEYQHAIRRVLSRGWGKHVVLRTLVIPPFSNEIVVGIRRDRAGYHAFVVEPTSHIWHEASPENKHPNYSKIRQKYTDHIIRDDVAVRCIRLWHRVLSDRQNYLKDENLYLDTTEVYFFVRLAPHEAISAWTHQWGDKTRAGELLTLSDALTAYIDGKMTEAKFLHLLEHAEKKVG
jgi:hypothetical protein